MGWKSVKCGWKLGGTPARTVDGALTALEAEKLQKRQQSWTEVTMPILDKSRRVCRVELQALLEKKIPKILVEKVGA